MVRAARWSMVTLVMVGVLSAPAGAVQKAAWNYGFDYCTWELSVHYWLDAGPATRVRDTNGWCKHHTAYNKNSDGTEYCKIGPAQVETLTSCSLQTVSSPTYHRGVTRAWETDRSQDSGWKAVSW